MYEELQVCNTVYVCMYVCIHGCMYVPVCICMYACMHLEMQASGYHACINICMRMQICVCMKKFVYVSASRKITNIILYSSACFRYTCTVPYSVSLETDTDILHSINIGIFIVLFYQFLSSLPSTFDTRMFT